MLALVLLEVLVFALRHLQIYKFTNFAFFLSSFCMTATMSTQDDQTSQTPLLPAQAPIQSAQAEPQAQISVTQAQAQTTQAETRAEVPVAQAESYAAQVDSQSQIPAAPAPIQAEGDIAIDDSNSAYSDEL